MDIEKIELVKDLAREYNQFQPSKLPESIMNVTGCNKSQAITWGESHCNLLSWYFGLYTSGKINMSYEEYFGLLLKNKCCNKAGKTLFTKDIIAKKCFGFDFKPIYIEDWNFVIDPSSLNPDSFYQLKIHTSDHYMISWIDNIKGKSELFIADTNDRGYGVIAKKAKRIDKSHFRWILEI